MVWEHLAKQWDCGLGKGAGSSEDRAPCKCYTSSFEDEGRGHKPRNAGVRCPLEAAEGRKQSSLEPPEGLCPHDTLIFHSVPSSSLPELEKNKFVLFKASKLMICYSNQRELTQHVVCFHLTQSLAHSRKGCSSYAMSSGIDDAGGGLMGRLFNEPSTHTASSHSDTSLAKARPDPQALAKWGWQANGTQRKATSPLELMGCTFSPAKLSAGEMRHRLLIGRHAV